MTGINKKIMKSQLFIQPQMERKFYSIPLTIIAYFLLWLAGLMVGRILAHFLLNGMGFAENSSDGYNIALRKLIVCGTQIGIFFLWVKGVEKRPVKSLGFQGRKPLKSYLIGFMVGLSAITSITLILAISDAVNFAIPNGNNYSLTLFGILILNFILIMIGWIIQSASEEIAIRGWLIPV